jgi:hypothetical protein
MSKLISTLINELTYGTVVGLSQVVAVGLEFELKDRYGEPERGK